MPAHDSKSSPLQALNLEIAREADRIELSLASQQTGAMQTGRHIEELAVPMETINIRCRAMVTTLNQANRQGNLSTELLERLKEAGQLFRDDLFSADIKSQLNTSPLTSLETTLRMGRLVAARLILYGRMVHSAPHTQITLRCIETETSKVAFVVNTVFDNQIPISDMADRIAESIHKEIQKQYPIRAHIIERTGDRLILDVGRLHGVSMGLRLKSIDSNLTIQVVEIKRNQCTATIKSGQNAVNIGLKVQEIP